jgi:hypothetical protein
VQQAPKSQEEFGGCLCRRAEEYEFLHIEFIASSLEFAISRAEKTNCSGIHFSVQY